MDTKLTRWRAQRGQDYLISTLEIQSDSQQSLFLCAGYEEVVASDGGTQYTFEPSPLQVAIPETSNTGNQTLNFGLQNVTTEAMQFVDKALANRESINVIYREWLSGDLTAVADRPIRMVAKQFDVQGSDVTVQCGHFDIINTSVWRQYYTGDQFPGVRYQ